MFLNCSENMVIVQLYLFQNFIATDKRGYPHIFLISH